MFKITGEKGFHITFDNGWTISVQFGAVNYCDHYDEFSNTNRELQKQGSKTAEVGIWDNNNDWYEDADFHEVEGYCTPKRVLELMNFVASKPRV